MHANLNLELVHIFAQKLNIEGGGARLAYAFETPSNCLHFSHFYQKFLVITISSCNVQALAIALETSSTLLLEAFPVTLKVSCAIDSSLESSVPVYDSDMEE